MQFLTPWYESRAASLADELRREVAVGHVLYCIAVGAVAQRQDKDEVLFELRDGTSRLAVVHLTYAVESDPRWPQTTLFESTAAWRASMEVDHAEFGE